MHVSALTVALIIWLICVPACSPESGSGERRAHSVYHIDTSISRPEEDPLLDIAAQVASFAGYFCENGNLVVGITADGDSGDSETVTDIVQSKGVPVYCYNRSIGLVPPQVEVRSANFSFLELRSWRDEIADEFFELGGHSIGIDYRENAIIMRTRSAAPIGGLAAAYGLPPSAYRVVEEDPTEFAYACPAAPYSASNVNGCFRPVPGGVQFESTNNGGTSPISLCTLTAATYKYINGPNYWQPGFVTASHCAGPMWSMASDWIHQFRWTDGTYFNDELIGVEFTDPAGWSCGSFTCRYSDSSWIWPYQTGGQHGTIAQTVGLGSKVMSPTNPRFYVWGSTYSVQGMQVEKVGQTTGWTTGIVSQVCADEVVGSLKILCSVRTSLGPNVGVESGDSGSPVFFWWWFYGVDTVEMIGLLYGKIGTDVGVYSPWSGVENDLGSLIIQYPYF